MLLLDANSFFSTEWQGVTFADYLWSIGIIIATMLLKRPVSNILTRLCSVLIIRFGHAKPQATVRSLLRKPIERMLQVILFYTAVSRISALYNEVSLRQIIGNKSLSAIYLDDVINHIFLFLFIIFLTQLLSRIISFAYRLRLDKARNEQNKAQQQMLPLMKEMAKLILWTICAFWIMGSVFHINVPALITGLGIGGIAIALAGKATVENLFAAFTIMSDKPFQVGETIKLGDMEGTVERIGFRSTRLRGSDGSAYIIPNQKLVGENLINLTWRNTRGFKTIIHIRFGIANDDVQKMIKELKQMIHDTPHVIEPVEVALENYGEKTFQLLIAFHVPYPLKDIKDTNEIKRRVNLAAYAIVAPYAANNASIEEG